MKGIVTGIFKNVKYWQDKKLLLQAIHPDYYLNKTVMLQLLGITKGNVLPENEAKRGMWNYHIESSGLGDDILRNINPIILKDFDFIKKAIAKYNRTYIFLPKNLQASREFAMDAVTRETEYNPQKFNTPILQYMPETLRIDNEIALVATTRNIENLQYATNLKKNKYFIIDIMNLLDDNKIKQKVLRYIDKSLLSDKRFVSKLGCFDNLCDNFHGDLEYIASAVKYDLSILKKTKMFDEAIIKSALENDTKARELVLADVFRYIERFNDDFNELQTKVKDKVLLGELFWEYGEIISMEFLS